MAKRTGALIGERIVDFSIRALRDGGTFFDGGVSSQRALTGVGLFVPDAAIGAGDLVRKTGFLPVSFSFGALARIDSIAPDHPSLFAARVHDAKLAVPESGRGALAAH